MEEKSPRTPSKVNRKESQKKKVNYVSKKLSKEGAIELLSKQRYDRTQYDNKLLGDYLSAPELKVEFFSQLSSPEDKGKLERLVSAFTMEYYNEGENVINFGEDGDKFYICMEGKVGIFKPIYVQKTMKLRDYLAYMYDIKYKELNTLKYRRVNEKNVSFGFDLEFLYKINPESYMLKRDYLLYLEDEEKLGEIAAIFAFGQVALLKKCPRTATIRAMVNSKIISIDKLDYNKIIKEIEEKRLEQELKDFKKSYPIFQHWSLSLVLRLANSFSNKVLLQGDYLYKQNEDSDCIYIIKSGIFEVYSLISFGWLGDFFDYIITPATNLLFSSPQSKVPLKETELLEFFEGLMKKEQASPCVFNQYKVPKAISPYQTIEEIDYISRDQEEISDPYNTFKVIYRRITCPDVVGLEEALEIKKRFCFIKCVSQRAEVEKVNLFDFYKLILANNNENNKAYFVDMIAKRKLLLFNQLRNAAIQRNYELGQSLSFRFHNLVNLKPTEETRMMVMKLKNIDFFDSECYTKDLLEKLISPTDKAIKSRAKRVSLIEAATKKSITISHLHESKSSEQLLPVKNPKGKKKGTSAVSLFNTKANLAPIKLRVTPQETINNLGIEILKDDNYDRSIDINTIINNSNSHIRNKTNANKDKSSFLGNLQTGLTIDNSLRSPLKNIIILNNSHQGHATHKNNQSNHHKSSSMANILESIPQYNSMNLDSFENKKHYNKKFMLSRNYNVEFNNILSCLKKKPLTHVFS